MNNIIKLAPIDKFVYRIPSKPINEFSNIDEGNTIEEIIRNFFNHRDVEIAIYLSSPSLFRELHNVLSGTQSDVSAKRLRSVCVSLFNYCMRMSMRATPFGILSFVGSGSIQSNYSEFPIKVSDDCLSVNLELSGEILGEISKYLEEIPSVRSNILYHINNTLYKYGNKLRYIDYSDKKSSRDYYVSEISATSLMEELVIFCKKGQKFSDLLNFITNKGFDKQDSVLFIEDLINNKVIISELEPNITRQTYHQQIYEFLKKNKETVNPLLYSFFSDLPETKISINSLNRIINNINELIPLTNEKNYFSVNSFISDDIKISDNIVDVVQNGFQLFLSYCKEESSKKSNFSTWKRAFENKFGSSFVNIKEAFDSDGGVYYGENIYTEGFDKNTFIDDIFTDVKSSNVLHLIFDKIDQFIIGEAKKVFAGLCKEIILPSTLLDNKIDTNAFPLTLNAFCQIGIEKSTLIVNFLNSLSDSSTCMLGRLSPFHEKIKDICSEMADWEQKQLKPGIVSEVNHSSSIEMANIVGRNVKRGHSISILSNESSTTTKEISLDDLYIGIYEDRVVLFDAKNKKEVFPVLSHAQNYNSELLPIYRFIADIQLNNCNHTIRYNRDVSYLLNLFNFQPRIVCENFIFSLAKWKVSCDNLRRIFQQEISTQISQIKDYFALNSIPFSFAIVKGDQKLYLNLNSAPRMALITLESECFNKSHLIIEESFYSLYPSILNDFKQRGYAAEYIFPFKNETNIINKNSNKDNDCISRSIETRVARTFFPFQSEWLFVKIYAGFNTLDRIILNHMNKIVSECYSKNLISIWYYIRYKDLMGSHLRLRLKIIDFSSQKCAEICDIIKSHLSCYAKNEITSISYETFKREMERYEPQYIETIESLFCIDSTFQCKALIRNLDNTNRFFFGLCIIQSYLNVFFGENIAKKIEFVNHRLSNFHKEFPNSKATRVKINKKFHSYIKQFDVYLSKEQLSFKDFENLIQERIVYLNIPYEIIPSIIHMSLVRLYKSRNRINEYVAFSFLQRYYIRQSFIITKNQ